jgi:RHS repeat-associated protein
VGEQGHYPYGEEWYMTNTTTHYVFTNYHRDDESGNDYALHRFNVNRLGRFSAVDPMPRRGTSPQSLNRYSYSHNDPIGREDPSGMLDNLVCGPLGDCGGAPRTFGGDFAGDIAAGNPSLDVGSSGPPNVTAFGRDPGNPFVPTDQCAPDDPSCECDPISGDCGCDPSVFGCGCDFFSDCPLPGEGSKVGWAHYVELVALLRNPFFQSLFSNHCAIEALKFFVKCVAVVVVSLSVLEQACALACLLLGPDAPECIVDCLAILDPAQEKQIELCAAAAVGVYEDCKHPSL